MRTLWYYRSGPSILFPLFQFSVYHYILSFFPLPWSSVSFKQRRCRHHPRDQGRHVGNATLSHSRDQRQTRFKFLLFLIYLARTLLSNSTTNTRTDENMTRRTAHNQRSMYFSIKGFLAIVNFQPYSSTAAKSLDKM